MNNFFPKHDDPKKYSEPDKYCLAWGKAIADEINSGEYRIFAGNAERYDLIRRYAQNKQPIAKYLKLSDVDEQADSTFMNVDFTPTGPLPKYRTLAIEKILAAEFGPVVTPIDMQSKDENDKMYAEMKAKLEMREMLQQADPELASHPALKPEPNEPQDIEELEMRYQFGEQWNRAQDAELIATLALYQNDARQLRAEMVEDMVDFGPAFYKTFINERIEPEARKVDLKSFVISRCRFPDFRDARWMGEFIYVGHDQIKNAIGGDEKKFAQVKDQPTMPMPFRSVHLNYPAGVPMHQDLMNGQALVFDFEFKTYNTLIAKVGQSKYGNPQVKRTFGIPGKNNTDITKSVEMIYTGKWVVGTDVIYDFGPQKNMFRNYSNPELMSKTCFSFKGFALGFNNMVSVGLMDRLMPLADDYMMCRIKIQNVRNQLIPNGWAINMDAIESVDLTIGGVNMDKEKIIDLFVKRGILVYRSKDISGDSNGNAKPIEMLQNSISNEIIALYSELQAIKAEMKDVLGLNDVTDGSTPSDRMLNGVASMAEQSTNTALRPIYRADRWIMENMASDLLKRAQQTIRKKGKYSGFAPAINGTTLQFVQNSPDMAYKEYGLMLEMRPNDEQKQFILQQLAPAMGEGILDSSIVFTILNTQNTKQAQMILAHRQEKGRKQKQQEALMMQQQNGQIQQQSAIAAEQAKQETERLKHKNVMEREKHITDRLIRLKEMELQSKEGQKQLESDTEIAKKDMEIQGQQPTGMPEMMPEMPEVIP